MRPSDRIFKLVIDFADDVHIPRLTNLYGKIRINSFDEIPVALGIAGKKVESGPDVLGLLLFLSMKEPLIGGSSRVALETFLPWIRFVSIEYGRRCRI